MRNTDLCNLANIILNKWSSKGVCSETDIKLSGEKQEMYIGFWQGNFCEGDMSKMAEHGTGYITQSETKCAYSFP